LIYPGLLDRRAQSLLTEQVRDVVREAPLVQFQTPYGKPMTVRISSAGKYGWTSDRTGYRYLAEQADGTPWPAVPPLALKVWKTVAGTDRQPESCLINFYAPEAKMGMHQDRDESDLTQPVVSISLGDDGLFRIGGLKRGGKTDSIWLRSGDVVVLGGEGRMNYHGIDRIKPETSTLLDKPGRLNLTMRVVT
jgi:alkylated DNA repair protein (DNA oxidative demethylase)